MEFGNSGLEGFREAEPYEFPEIEGQVKKPMIQTIMDYILDQDSADAAAGDIAEATGFNRVNISKSLTKSGRFVVTRKEGRKTYYGVKETTE